MICAFISSANAQPIGRAAYAIQHRTWPCKAFLKSIDAAKTLHISFLWHTFGRNNACLNKVLADPRLKLLQVALVNDTCTRYGRCGKYELLAGMSVKQVIDALANEKPKFIEKYRAYLAEASGFLLPRLQDRTACYITPLLESNVNGRAASVAIRIAKEYFGTRCKVGWNQVGNRVPSGTVGAQFIEEHGVVKGKSEPCIVNLDGQDISFRERPSKSTSSIREDKLRDWFQSNRHCAATFLWVTEDNCRDPQRFQDPRKRSCGKNAAWDAMEKYLQ